MRLLESSALNQLRIGVAGSNVVRGDEADNDQQGALGINGRQRMLMQYIVVSNLYQSLTDFMQRHNDSHR